MIRVYDSSIGAKRPQLVIERCKRQVEFGADIVVLMDSLTRVAGLQHRRPERRANHVRRTR